MQDEQNYGDWCKLAEGIAREAGQRLAKAVHGTQEVNEETQHDVKIQLDVDTQEQIEKQLLSHFSDHHILGEEGGGGNGGKGIEWIIDPIDGTVNLVYGIPHFCVSIGCRVEGEYVLGVVYDPNRDECFTAVRGHGAFCNGRPIRVSSRTNLDKAILSLGFSKSSEAVEHCLELVRFYAVRVRKLRAMGSAALDMAYVAAGRFDAYIEQGISAWDIAAGKVLIEEAGGQVDLVPREEREKFRIKAWNGKMELPHA